MCHPKIKTPMEKKIGIIYWYWCQELECDNEYIKESSTFRVGSKNTSKYLTHTWPPDHQTTIGHPTTLDNFSIVGRKGKGFARTIKESIFIRENNPTLIKNIGKYNLPHIWNEVLNNTPELQLENQQGLQH